MNNKRISSLILSAVMLLGIAAGCGSETGTTAANTTAPSSSANASAAPDTNTKAEIVLKYGDVNPDGHILLDSAKFFAYKVSEPSSGRIKIGLYP